MRFSSVDVAKSVLIIYLYLYLPFTSHNPWSFTMFTHLQLLTLEYPHTEHWTDGANKQMCAQLRDISTKNHRGAVHAPHTHRLPIICINHEGVCQCVRVRVCYLVCLFRYRHNSQYPNILLPGRLTHARTPHQKCSINKLNIPCVAHGLWFIFRNAMFQSSRIQTHTHTCAIHSPNIQVQFGINDKYIQFKMLIQSQQ